MDDLRVGRLIRAIRHRHALRQQDLAEKARVSQDMVSRIERGRLGAMTLEPLRRVAQALDAEVIVTVRWRGGELDRLLDEGHAALLGRVAAWIEGLGWVVRPEVTYSVYGERGSIDLLAWHEATRTLLVIEIKTEITSIEETLRRHDAKVRLAARIAGEEWGWQPRQVARLLVLPDSTTARRRVVRHDAVLRRAYADRGPAVRAWLRSPRGGQAGLLFVSGAARASIRRKRIRAAPC